MLDSNVITANVDSVQTLFPDISSDLKRLDIMIVMSCENFRNERNYL